MRSSQELHDLGRALIQEKRYAAAVALFSEALSVDPSIAEKAAIWVDEAWALINLERNDQARESLARALSIDSANATACACKARILNDDGEFLAALESAARIVNVSSGAGSLTLYSDPTFPYRSGFSPAYHASKTALNAMTVATAIDLESTGSRSTPHPLAHQDEPQQLSGRGDCRGRRSRGGAPCAARPRRTDRYVLARKTRTAPVVIAPAN